MTKIFFRVLSPTFLFLMFYCNSLNAQNQISVLDLRSLNNLDLNNPHQADYLWDIMHATATLQGIVNRHSPKLYIRYVYNERGQNIDDYWWNKYRQAGKWLADSDTIGFTNLVDMVKFYKNEIKGAVVYDPKVASTSNIASSVAGIENLIAVRYDTTSNSLYHLLIENGPKLEVKCWLIIWNISVPRLNFTWF